jgi:Kef-type K+ transport system membrane component KefB
VFFVVAGLSLDIGALHPAQLGLLALILVVAMTGKLVPAYTGARLGGLDSGSSATIAVLLNCRGMTEIVALTAGLTAGILDRTVFTLMVIMALVTTATTAVLLRVIAARTARTAGRAGDPVPAVTAADPYRPT